MSERPKVLVTRPIMPEPTRRLQERCDVLIHENEFGIPRDELLEVVRGYDADSGGHHWSDRFDRAGHDDVALAAAISGNRLVVGGRSTSTNKFGFQSFWIVRDYKL